LIKMNENTRKYNDLVRKIHQGLDNSRNPRDTRRFIQLACSLEPLSEKEGLTTRSTNLNSHQKLEFFLAAGINIGDAFEDLAQRVLSSKRQPEVIYDLGYQAQLDSKKNRRGGRINHGIIEMLTPIVTAQLLFDPSHQLTTGEILRKTVEVLGNTSRKDVDYLIKLKRAAYDISGMFDRPVPPHGRARNVLEYYDLDLKDTKRYSSKIWDKEFTGGFPVTQKFTEAMERSRKHSITKKVEEAFTIIRNSDHKNVVPAVTADCVACGIYLYLSKNPKKMLIT